MTFSDGRGVRLSKIVLSYVPYTLMNEFGYQFAPTVNDFVRRLAFAEASPSEKTSRSAFRTV